MKKSSSSNFRNYCIFENEDHYSNSNRDIRKYNSNYNDYSILQKKKTFEDEIKNYDLSLTHDNKNDFYNYYDNYYDNNYENYNDNYGNNKSDKNIPSASNRDNLEFSLIKNNSDKDINTENKNNSNSNSNNNSNNNFIKGQYENDSNVIIGENDNNVTFPDSDIDYLMNIFNVSRERVIQALKEQKGNIEGAADSILNNAI
jgi:NACalpha-BTF3-like transcription factor